MLSCCSCGSKRFYKSYQALMQVEVDEEGNELPGDPVELDSPVDDTTSFSCAACGNEDVEIPDEGEEEGL